jgi:hypothetical protein
MCGDRKPYDNGLFYNSAKFFEMDYVSIGAGRYADDGQDEETVVSRSGHAARRFIHRNGVVTGVTSVGANDDARKLIEIVGAGANLAAARSRLGGRGW